MGGDNKTLPSGFPIVSEPDPSHRTEEGCGHHLTFELSPGQNVDLTNQKR